MTITSTTQLESKFQMPPTASSSSFDITDKVLSRLKEWQTRGVPAHILVEYPSDFRSFQQLEDDKIKEVRKKQEIQTDQETPEISVELKDETNIHGSQQVEFVCASIFSFLVVVVVAAASFATTSIASSNSSNCSSTLNHHCIPCVSHCPHCSHSCSPHCLCCNNPCLDIGERKQENCDKEAWWVKSMIVVSTLFVLSLPSH